MMSAEGSVDRFTPRLAWSMWAVALAVAAATLVLRVSAPASYGEPAASELVVGLYWNVLIPAAVPAFATVGAIVAARRPRHPVGWLALALAAAVGLEDLAWLHAYRAVELGVGPALGGVAAGWLSGIALSVTLPLLTLLLLHFPDGGLPSRRWRAVRWLAITLGLAGAVSAAFGPEVPVGLESTVANPWAITILAPALTLVIAWIDLGLLAALALGAFAIVRRRVWADAPTRRQITWLALDVGLAVAAGLVALGLFVAGAAIPAVLVGGVGVAALTIGVPVAIGVAVLRYRLYQVDRIVSRTVSYGALSTLLGVTYVGLAMGLAQLLAPLTSGSDLAVAGATLGVAGLFRPARTRIQRVVDRQFDRGRYDAERTIAAFRNLLRDEVYLEALASELCAAVESTVQPAGVSIWRRKMRS